MAAKNKQQPAVSFIKADVNRKGVHAKTKTSVNKDSKNYSKPYKGQGR